LKRSKINAALRDAETFLKEHHFYLPPFAHWSPHDWAKKGPEASEIAAHHLGWDVTDFGRGDYDKYGLLLFTIRNGSAENLKAARGKLYCEKLLLIGVNQGNPLHFHWIKTEDIINRGGGTLMIQLYNATEGEKLADTDVTVSLDGIEHTFPAGHIVALGPGESITLTTSIYHNFWAEGEMVLCGEVSLVNDDYTDNCFLEPLERFSEIEEDEPPLHLLVGDYARYYPYAR
jgi:hypothetical protein